VEIRQHRFHRFEFETGIDEEVSCAGTFDDRASALANCVFQSANRGGADGNHTARRAEGLVNSGSGGC
jgi:hypothetical protein